MERATSDKVLVGMHYAQIIKLKLIGTEFWNSQITATII